MEWGDSAPTKKSPREKTVVAVAVVVVVVVVVAVVFLK